MLFARNIRDQLKIEADADFDCARTGRFKKSIIKSGSLPHANSGSGECQTREDYGIEVVNNAFWIRLANSESSRVELLQPGNCEKG
jgi:hypothetical protein